MDMKAVVKLNIHICNTAESNSDWLLLMGSAVEPQVNLDPQKNE